MSKKSRPSSLLDVAEIAGVSIQTVSNVLNFPEKVRPKTRDEVLKAVKKLQLYATGIILLIGLFFLTGLVIECKTKWIMITVCALLFAIFSGYSSIISGIQASARQRSIVAIHQGMEH